MPFADVVCFVASLLQVLWQGLLLQGKRADGQGNIHVLKPSASHVAPTHDRAARRAADWLRVETLQLHACIR